MLAEAPPRLADADWRRYQEHYAALTADLPAHSCSVPGNTRAEAFAFLLAPVLGPRIERRVLDLGCGVVPLPVYLQGYDLRYVYGIDPLPPVGSDHPFHFEYGVAEALPWPDGWFGTVVCATSLDHMADPRRAMREAARVLEPGGLLVLWETVLPPEQAGPDEHHGFRFTWRGLVDVLEPDFRPVALHWTGHPFNSDLIGVWERA